MVLIDCSVGVSVVSVVKMAGIVKGVCLFTCKAVIMHKEFRL